jgi:hypothetical protein
MRDDLLEVITLQRSYSSENTPAMQRRGVLIRQVLRDELQRASSRLKAALGPHGEDLGVQGRDGTGQKTLIPWLRFFSRAKSPGAQRGWFCVYLFNAAGTGVYLALQHGSTNLVEGEYRPRPPEDLARLVVWGREVLTPVIRSNPNLVQHMVLQGGDLAGAYERSTVLAKFYSAADLPNDAALFDDAAEFAGYLKLIYDAQALGLSPSTPPPEVLEVETVAAGQPERRGIGQGFGLSTAERRVVEMHAMRLAKAHLESCQWRVRDVSASRPYDFLCKRGSQEMIVEVKGTTTTGDQIVLTKNEIAAHRLRHPNNALIVVHSINLIRTPDNPSANGGELIVLSPWEIEESQLQPLAFQYTVQNVSA